MEANTPDVSASTRYSLLQGDSGKYLMILVFLALLVRFVPGYLIYGSFDVGSWRTAIRDIGQGINPYVTHKLNWPPLWATLLRYTGRMEEVYQLPDYFSVKVIPIICDSSIAIALYIWFQQSNNTPKVAFKKALWYALNPVAIFTCAFHGQFDALPALFSMLAVMAVSRLHATYDYLRSSFWLALGILSRTWPVILLPILLRDIPRWDRKVVYILLALAPAVLSVWILYLQLPDVIMKDVINYRGGNGGWGLASPTVFLSRTMKSRVVADLLPVLYLALLSLYYVTWRRGIELTRAACLAVLTFYVFSPNVGIQHLVWVIGIAALADLRRMKIYSLVAGSYIASFYYLYPFNGEHYDFIKHVHTKLFWANFASAHTAKMSTLIALPLWLFCIWWYFALLRDSLRPPEHAVVAASNMSVPGTEGPL